MARAPRPAMLYAIIMPLNLTKIAFGCASISILQERLAARGPQARLTTRYRPKRADEMVGGSLYWIIANRLVARSPIIAFEDADGGKTDIVIDSRLVPVLSTPRRGHQGWRYLAAQDAPADAGAGDGDGAMPHDLRDQLNALGLI
ncbi:MAG: DUF1489 family protein [Sphingopyxis sp.]